MSFRRAILFAVLASCAAPWPASPFRPVCVAAQEEPPAEAPAQEPPAEPAPAPSPKPATPPESLTIAERLALGPNDPVLLNEYGNQLVAGGKLEAAYDQYRMAVRIAPELAVAWNNLGVTCAALGKYGEAEAAYGRAVRVNRYYALARYNLGVAYDRQGKYSAAIEQYQKAIENDPGLLDVRKNPQIASNRHLAAVLVKSYLDRGGSVLLPVESALPPPPPKKKRGS